MKGFQKASNLEENLNHTSRAKNQSTAEVNQPKENYPMRRQSLQYTVQTVTTGRLIMKLCVK